MAIRVALHHRTEYRYDDPSEFGPHLVRLRPAPHARTPVLSYSLRVEPTGHYINWQQDPYGNYVARLVFPERSNKLVFDVDLTAEMTVINPFDFFLEPAAEEFPFTYHPALLHDLMPFLHVSPALDNSPLAEFLRTIDRRKRRTNDFLVEVNQKLSQHIGYLIRMEPGVQTCDETLTKLCGSCRDTSWLLVNILRHMGLAARFTSGYLIQLKPDQKSLDGPSGAAEDFTDLHAWAEVFLPGAGWVGLDPTSGLLTGEGHIPLACTPEPISAAPITGTTSEPPVDFKFDMKLTRIHEDPRVTLPYSDEQWDAINALGQQIDEHLHAGDVRLTMGGEPTFVSIDDMEGEEWKTAALGENKLRLAGDLLWRLKHRFSSGALVHFGQGKWYPGEPLPRWSLRCYWRKDFEPIWQDEALVADPIKPGTHNADDARRFGELLAKKLQVSPSHVINGYEDALYYTWKERRLPANVSICDSKLEDEVERARLARVFEQGITSPVGCVLPLRRVWWVNEPYWESGEWVVRSDEMFLIPGDSPMGYRLPILSLSWSEQPEFEKFGMVADPLAPRGPLPQYRSLRDPSQANVQKMKLAYAGGGGGFSSSEWGGSEWRGDYGLGDENTGEYGHGIAKGFGDGHEGNGHSSTGLPIQFATGKNGSSDVVRTAICIEPRGGVLHVFMPPTDHLVDYLDLVAKIEATAAELQLPVAIEGYEPPHDHRLQHLKVTPDPGVIEVNVQPAHNWREVVDITTGVYEDAHNSRLATEKFDLDGSHTGTGGGNHVVLGGPTPNDSPFLRRPDLLKSLVGYWHNHPSLSYMFSGAFIGPTSQAPRVDEGRRDARYELQIAFEQVVGKSNVPPWLVDRVFRNLLVDVTGNTHRAEFCIDKLYSPDSSSGRLGLIEFRGFEMPPHARMSLAQQVLLRALVAHFWEEPYNTPLVDWDTSLHDRFLLPHFAKCDFADVVEEIRRAGYHMEFEWFGPHFEFRYPVIGKFSQANVQVELRKAVEPWYVLGEEPGGGGTARYVDSSVERMQVKVNGMTNPRHILTCNGRKLPLHPTGTEGEYVAGVRYRAWQPPSCLHPTIPVDTPLVFDVLDTWLGRSLGGATYHVSHPGGLNPTTFPVNAFEAESRRGARFSAMGHSGGEIAIPGDEVNPDYPMTLDLRRGRQNGIFARETKGAALLTIPDAQRLLESAKQHVNLFGDYTCNSQSYDEVFSAVGKMHPHWQRFAEAAAHLSSEEFGRRWLQAQRLLRQNSLAYPDPSDPDARKHPWALDAFPLTIGADEWQRVSEALKQRAVVLDLLLRDLFGPRRLLQEGTLPPEVLFRHPGFLLPYASGETAPERMLHLYAADLSRSPDGEWWVMADRTEAPSGAGFALENRIAMSRMMPDVVHHCRVERHAPYFKAMQRHLAGLAPRNDTEPRIVLLSRSAGTANYFEDAFLARYLGYTLAEAGDLDVRDDQVFIKTLAGLSRVDVLWRRPNSEHCDPLELSSVSPSGVAGLVQAVRSRGVAVANNLGSGLVESPIFMAFLPQICQALLGEPLQMPGVATFWCGEEKSRQHVLANLDKLVIKPAYRRRGFTRSESQTFAQLSRREIAIQIEKEPGNFVAQEIVFRSTAPVWSEITSERAYIALRTFAVANDESYEIMPGGLTRLSATLAPLELSLLDGEGSKDTWVLADGPVEKVTLLQTADEPVEIRRGGVDLSSRAAEHFFWLGRLTTRTESLGKWVRAVASRLATEADAESIPELPILIRGLATQGMIEPGVVVEEIRDQLPRIERLLPAAVFNNDDVNALRSTVSRMTVLASSVRDLMSLDSWRIIRQMDDNFWSSPKSDGLLDVMEKVNELLVQLAALGGNVAESMTRTHAWRFLDLGRRLEHALQTAILLSSVLDAKSSADHALLESLLEICDSLMTYRFRYSSRVQLAPVLDLLLCDDTNPRSVLYQVMQCFNHVNQLPRDIHGPNVRVEQTLVSSISTLLKSTNSQEIAAAYYAGDAVPLKELLKYIEGTLPKLSDAISHRYFFHSGPVVQLAKINPK